MDDARAIVARSLGLAEDDDAISRVLETITAMHHPKNLTGYVSTLAARGDLEKYRNHRPPARTPARCGRPVGRSGMSEACKSGDGPKCGYDWCGCQCHAERAPRPPAGRAPEAGRPRQVAALADIIMGGLLVPADSTEGGPQHVI